MKKMILGIALMASMMASAPAFAQKQQCKDSTQCKEICEFAALDLSESQRVKLNQINDSYSRKNKELFKKGGDEQRLNRDSIRTAIRNQAKDLRRNKLKEVKAVLTQDQYVQFLEENYVNAPAKGPRHDKKGMKPGMKQGMKPGMKHRIDMRGDRAAKAQFDKADRPQKSKAEKNK